MVTCISSSTIFSQYLRSSKRVPNLELTAGFSFNYIWHFRTGIRASGKIPEFSHWLILSRGVRRQSFASKSFAPRDFYFRLVCWSWGAPANQIFFTFNSDKFQIGGVSVWNFIEPHTIMYHLNSSSGLFISSNNSHFVEKLKKFCSDEQINRNFKFKFCPKPTSLPGISSSVSNCSPLCEDMNLYQILFAYLYPLLLILCIVGNVLNICVYMESHLRTSSTVRLLYAKALANISFLITLFPGLIKVYYPESAAVESFFWLSNPTAVFLANSFGGCATW